MTKSYLQTIYHVKFFLLFVILSTFLSILYIQRSKPFIINNLVDYKNESRHARPTKINTKYFVDCQSGDDKNTGLSENNAWKSLGQVNTYSFKPSDAILLKSGCEWSDQLIISSNGRSGENIFISSYGTGNKPLIKNNSNTSAVSIKGSYITLDNLEVNVFAASQNAGCSNAYTGTRLGISLESESSYNTVKNSKISGAYAGVFIKNNSSYNNIINNEFKDNNMMYPLDAEPDTDAGAFGILIWGDDNLIEGNTISGSDACSYDYVRDGSAIEVYGGKRNVIKKNFGFNDDAFSELGNSRTSDNMYLYNLFVSSLPRSIFIVTRGNSKYGPVYNTVVINNTAYLTGAQSQGFACISCGTNILTLNNNIIWANGFIGRSEGSFIDQNNLYWGSGRLAFVKSISSWILDPKFKENGIDFHLLPDSPARKAGVNYGEVTDIEGKKIPFGNVDLGAFTY